MTNDQPRRPRAIILPDDGTVQKPEKTSEAKTKQKSSKSRQPQAEAKAQAKAGTKAKQTNKDATSGKKARHPRSVSDATILRDIPDEAAQRAPQGSLEGLADDLTPPPPPVSKRRFSWSKLFFGALAGLVSLGIGLWVDQLIRDLFSRQDWLGWLAVGLTALLVLAALAVVLRELFALRRLRQIEALREAGEQARIRNDMAQAKKVSRTIVELYENRPETAKGRAALTAHASEIIDGRDLMHLTERDLLKPLDSQARSMVMASAKRVSVVTAVSPRAIVDISYVLLENTRLIRRIADHYGGRPGTIGFWRLTRTVLAHLAVTGSIAIGDGLLQQVIGSGLAARLSARLGEGVVNGMLTARIGIAAIDVCRPLPFAEETRPGVKDFMGELLKSAESDKDQRKT